MNLCEMCINPLESKAGTYCPSCESLLQDDLFDQYKKGNIFDQEFYSFLDSRERAVFAYSGGLDSTAALHLMNNECRGRGIELICFTIDHGFKGKRTKSNIANVLEYENLQDNHIWIDISQEMRAEGAKVEDFFLKCVEESDLPCGKRCNSVIDGTYGEILNRYGETVLVTGGDTPKWRPDLKRYSILWQLPDITILRGAATFKLSKEKNSQLIKDHKIPWKDVGCGGYDTDCLIPGTIFRNLTQGKTYNFQKTMEEFPIILEYLSERVRWGIIDRDLAIKQMSEIDIADDQSLEEIKEIS